MHLCCDLEIRINCAYYCICYLQEIQYSFLFFCLGIMDFRVEVQQWFGPISDLSHTLFITPHIYYTIPTKLKMQFRIAPYVLVMKCNKSRLLGWYLGNEDQQRFGLWDQTDQVLIENGQSHWSLEHRHSCVWTFQFVMYNVLNNLLFYTSNCQISTSHKIYHQTILL